MATGREVVTDFEPAIEAALHDLDALAKVTNNWSTAVIALWTGRKVVRLLASLVAIRNAFLGIAAAETAVMTAGFSRLAKLGVLGSAGYEAYQLFKHPGDILEHMNLFASHEARSRELWKRDQPNGEPYPADVRNGARTSTSGTSGTMSKADVIAYIRQSAIAHGIDPDQAVRVAASEGLNKYTGDYGTSFGPFQLHYGASGILGMNVSGLGDVFTRQTDLDARNPATTRQQIDFALAYAALHGWGPWHGWKGAPFAGIERMHRSISDSLAKIPSSASVLQLPFFARGGAALYPMSPVSNYDHSTSSQATINTINVVTKGDVDSIAKGKVSPQVETKLQSGWRWDGSGPGEPDNPHMNCLAYAPRAFLPCPRWERVRGRYSAWAP